ncbi:hypothetical protein K440DRAFT_639372 [Wilcoxina mikolae CBS 423.85]|nr:hypothetical protein K440DRAFT_639372 [Wilcoxina mikolae CBS 423.85]
MSSSSPKLQEWLCIFPDQEGAHKRRLEARPSHFEGVNASVSEGFITWAGAVLNEVPADSNPQNFKFYGSVLTVTGATKEEVIEKLKNDPYTKGEVWDWEKAQIFPFLCAVREPLKK